MKIVVVEDVPMVRERIVDALLELPEVVVVGEADSVETALSTIESNQPDVVLLDMSLPSAALITGGMGILKWIKQTYPAIYVVMLTNHAGQAYREACEAAGAYSFLDKSYEFDKLPVVISQLGNDFLSHSQPVSSIPEHKLGRAHANNPLADQLDRLTHNSRRLVLWLYFVVAVFSYLRASRKEHPPRRY